MEPVLFFLRKAMLKHDEMLQLKIYEEIVVFLSKITNTERRKLLVDQLCCENLIIVLKDGITSNVKTLLWALKVLCLISESDRFLEFFWATLKPILRALIFMVHSRSLYQLQNEFIEIIFMIDILFKRFKNNASLLNEIEDITYTIKSLINICQCILKDSQLHYCCKLSMFLLFSEVLNISKQFRELLKDFYHGVFPKILNTGCLFLELYHDVVFFEQKTLAVFLSIISWVYMISIDGISPLHQLFKFRVLTTKFQNTYWSFLFEDASNINLADFLITSFSWVLGLMVKDVPQMMICIAEGCISREGLERLIAFLADKRCKPAMGFKIKMLINQIIHAVKLKNVHHSMDMDTSLLFENFENFKFLHNLNSEKLSILEFSFINIFFVLLKYNLEKYIEQLTIIQRSIFDLYTSNKKKLRHSEFWLLISIHEISKKAILHNGQIDDVGHICHLNDDYLQQIFIEEFCLETKIFQYEQFAWLKDVNQQLFEKNVVLYLDQDVYETRENNFKCLASSISFNEIVHLLLSNNYNQVINASKILTLHNSTREDLHHLLQLIGNYENINELQSLAIYFLISNKIVNVSHQKDSLLYIIKMIKSTLTTVSKDNVELKVMMIDLIYKVIRFCDWINVNIIEE